MRTEFKNISLNNSLKIKLKNSHESSVGAALNFQDYISIPDEQNHNYYKENIEVKAVCRKILKISLANKLKRQLT